MLLIWLMLPKFFIVSTTVTEEDKADDDEASAGNAIKGALGVVFVPRV